MIAYKLANFDLIFCKFFEAVIYFIETQYLTFHQYGENVPKKLNRCNKLQFAMPCLYIQHTLEKPKYCLIQLAFNLIRHDNFRYSQLLMHCWLLNEYKCFILMNYSFYWIRKCQYFVHGFTCLQAFRLMLKASQGHGKQ